MDADELKVVLSKLTPTSYEDLIKYATLLDFINSDQFYELPDDVQAIIRDYTEELGEEEL